MAYATEGHIGFDLHCASIRVERAEVFVGFIQETQRFLRVVGEGRLGRSKVVSGRFRRGRRCSGVG